MSTGVALLPLRCDGLEAAKFRQERGSMLANGVIMLGGKAGTAMHNTGGYFQLVGRVTISPTGCNPAARPDELPDLDTFLFGSIQRRPPPLR